MDIDLVLWKVSGSSLVSLVGEPGVYGAGNVASISTIDNIEHLSLTDLEPGDYAIEVRRKSGAQSAQPVADGFSYDSGSNPEFLTVDQLRGLIDRHVMAAKGATP